MSDTKVNNIINIGKGISQNFGDDCETVIIDATNLENSVISVHNGCLTGRKIGDPMNQLELYFLQSDLFNDIDIVSNYKTEGLNGELLKTTTIFIRDDRRKIIGFLSINYLLKNLFDIRKHIDKFCNAHNDIEEDKKISNEEGFYCNTLEDLLNKLYEEAKTKIGKPLNKMKKEDKLKIVEYLYEKQFFLVKGAIEDLADRLNITRYTIYNYLTEIKSVEKESPQKETGNKAYNIE